MKLQNIILEQIRLDNKKLLESVTHNVLPQQRYIIEGVYEEFLPLIEASLTADQVKTLFGEIEKQSISGGQSRTVVGAGVDIAKKANEVINNVGKWLQDTTPVKMADQKFDQLKAKVGAKFPELDKQLTGLGTWMKDNPGKSAAIIGVMTALASLAGGPVGGAIAGQVLRGTAELVKGEKLSTAVGKGIKTAALGFIAGKAFEMLGNWMAGFREQSIPFGPADAGLERVSWGASKSLSAPGMEWTRTTQGFNHLVRQEEATAIRELMAQIKTGTNPEAFDSLLAIAREIKTDDYKNAMDGMVQGAWKAAKDNDSLLQFINTAKEGLQAGAQGAVAASTGTDNKDKKESYYVQLRPLSEGQIYLLFDRIESYSKIEPISEGPLDALKKGVGAVVKGASWLGKQATEKITSAKLLASWKLEGSPTDSDEVAGFLKDQGVQDAVIDASYSTMNLPPPASTATADTKDEKDSKDNKQPTQSAGTNFEAGQIVTYTNAKGEAKQATVIKQLDTVDAQGDPQIQLKSGNATFAVDRDRIQVASDQSSTATGDQYQQAVDMISKLPTERKVRLLKALLKNTAETGTQAATA